MSTDYYWDPVRLSLKKKLSIGLKKEKKRGYFLQNFLGKSLERTVLDILTVLHEGSTISLQNFVYSNAYIKEQKALTKLHGQLSVTSYQSQKKSRYLGFKKDLYRKMDKEESMSLETVLKIKEGMGYNFFNYMLWFDVEITKDNYQKLNKEINQYIKAYMSGDLTAGEQRFFSYPNQRSVVIRTLGELAKYYGSKNLPIKKTDLFSWVGTGSSQQQNILQTKFLETLLGLEYEGLIEVVDILDPLAIRVTIKPANSIPALDDWNREFYNIASSLSYFNFIKNKKKASGKTAQSLDNEEQLVLQWEDLSLNTKTGIAILNNVNHRFRPVRPHYKILKKLLEANGQDVTYEEFFKVAAPSAVEDPKNGKEFIRQKIRDIRKYFKINRKKDLSKDIFYDTGDGFRLMRLSLESPTISE